jgi:hypothetical protein
VFAAAAAAGFCLTGCQIRQFIRSQLPTSFWCCKQEQTEPQGCAFLCSRVRRCLHSGSLAVCRVQGNQAS